MNIYGPDGLRFKSDLGEVAATVSLVSAVAQVVLADGQLPSEYEYLYTVSPTESVEVGQIILVNRDSAPRTIYLYVEVPSSSGARLITPDGMFLEPGVMVNVLPAPLQLSGGTYLAGHADAADQVDYLITGTRQ